METPTIQSGLGINLETRDSRCLLASIRNTAKVRPTTFDLCCSPLGEGEGKGKGEGEGEGKNKGEGAGEDEVKCMGEDEGRARKG